jgi:hypothetical protein
MNTPLPQKKVRFGCGGVRWTRRLKRFGGLQPLLEVRARQMQLVGVVMKRKHKNHKQLELDWEFLCGNALRTLPPAVEAYWAQFAPPKREST